MQGTRSLTAMPRKTTTDDLIAKAKAAGARQPGEQANRIDLKTVDLAPALTKRQLAAEAERKEREVTRLWKIKLMLRLVPTGDQVRPVIDQVQKERKTLGEEIARVRLLAKTLRDDASPGDIELLQRALAVAKERSGRVRQIEDAASAMFDTKRLTSRPKVSKAWTRKIELEVVKDLRACNVPQLKPAACRVLKELISGAYDGNIEDAIKSAVKRVEKATSETPAKKRSR
jgi:hypothetical protein